MGICSHPTHNSDSGSRPATGGIPSGTSREPAERNEVDMGMITGCSWPRAIRRGACLEDGATDRGAAKANR